ncbi:MAG: hypothetical protein L0I24_00285 [Pseudonocardia sp.]|nr:hypothetical protein [Pseudonocardia sp.]
MTHPAGSTPPTDTDAVIITGPWPDPAAEVVAVANESSSYRSPLDCDSNGVYPTALRGGVVTDPDEIRAIRRSIEAHVEPGRFRAAWRRRLRALGRQGGRA